MCRINNIYYNNNLKYIYLHTVLPMGKVVSLITSEDVLINNNNTGKMGQYFINITLANQIPVILLGIINFFLY